ncbi:MAG: apolipoprotein N-acyltransferase [Bacteriovoracaceae bacterium]|jgi:apolipoprotein N-acyltransferase|nr:apolipoprotein N-acyltransferase [Bacteriovoracaceae bacterium]
MNNKIKSYAYLLLAGFLYTLGFPNILNIYIPIFPIIATAILLHFFFTTKTTKERIFGYFIYNSVINGVSFYWITNTLQEFGKLPFSLAAIMNALYAFIFTPHYWLLIILLFINDRYFKKDITLFKYGLTSSALAGFITTIEYIVPQQFPVMLGHPWIIFSEYLGAARFFGLPLFSFFSYLLALEIIRIVKLKRTSYINLISLCIFIFINPFLIDNSQEDTLKKFNVRLVQANISNFLKTDSETGTYASTSEVLNRYEKLSSKPFNKAKSLDLIVWPETAYPFSIKTSKPNIKESQVPKIFQRIASETNAEVFFGGYEFNRINPDGSFYKTDYNAGILLDKNAQVVETYHKHVLIPFGETLPLGPFNQWASKLIPEMAFFEEGEKFPLFSTQSEVQFISSICYEILRPEFVRDYLNSVSSRPHVMINLTNDGWYGNTVEPEQHLFLTKWRAIEFDLPILRSTNTGISTFIDHRAKEIKRLDYGIADNLDLSLNLKNRSKGYQTFYQQFGFWGVLPIWLIIFLFHILLIKLKYVQKS